MAPRRPPETVATGLGGAGDAASSASVPGHEPINDAPYRILRDVELGERVQIHAFTNLYGCRIGDDTRIGTFVEVQAGASIGRRCKIQSHTFVCDGVEIGDEVFVGHGVVFVNDKFPRATNAEGELQRDGDWATLATVVERGASLGSGALLLGGVRVGAGATVGAGAVVTADVRAGAVVAGVPARARPPSAGSDPDGVDAV